ncbi:MAG TPA: hypothetical protein VEZ42_07720 [Pseudonocardia sp.]|nr:hypothetical protein [Pseudonocardia sp.]
MSTTASPAAGPRPGTGASSTAQLTGHLFTGLELFWPSRRGHSFDELCR